MINLAGGGISAIPQKITNYLEEIEKIAQEIGETVILPVIFQKHYDSSGLKSHTGILKAALTKPGATGNVLTVAGGKITAGIDYSAVPGSKEALEGRGAIKAKTGHSLRFYDENGKPIFVKSVRAAPAHPVIYLTSGETAEIGEAASAKIVDKLKNM